MLHYIDQGSGETVVLLHGFCGSSQYWQYIMPTLANKYRVIAPDLPGHGQSEAPTGKLTMEDYAEQIVQLIDQLQIEKCILLGHSMGGYITLAFAEKYPNRLNAFGLIHSSAYPDDDQGKAGRDKNIQLIRDKGNALFIHQLIPKLFAPQHIETMEDIIQHVEKIGLQTSPEGAIAALESMRDRQDRNHVLVQSDLPILLVAGEHDLLIAPNKTFVLKGPKIAQLLIREAGHMSMYEASEQLLIGIQSLLNFVHNHSK